MTVPAEYRDGFAQINATLRAVYDTVEDVLDRHDELAAKINASPELCDDGVPGNASLEAISESGMGEACERLELISARLQHHGLGYVGIEVSEPDWYIKWQEREEAKEARHWQEYERLHAFKERTRELENRIFELTTEGLAD